MADYHKSVEMAYQQRTQFILVALTGRTGVGCTTTASILKKPFSELDLHTPKDKEFNSVNERKYSIIYNFMQDDHWSPFTVIEGSSIILSFVIGASHRSLIDYFKQFQHITESNNVRIESFAEVFKRLEGIDYLFDNQNLCDPKGLDSIDSILNEEKTVKKYYEFYVETLPKLKKEFKDILQTYSCYIDEHGDQRKANLYSFFMQQIGNNVRSSGNPYLSQYTEDHFYSVADRIDKVIKLIQKYNENNTISSTRVCIDAIRNPYEAFYFKDKYSSFYLMSVNTDEETRRKRMSYLDAEALKHLDETEFPTSPNEIDGFFHQSIPACLEISDIHLYNPQQTCGKNYFLTEQLVKYVSLMIHPGLVTPTNIERCMQLAYNARLNSGCLSRQIGAVITDQHYSVKAVGWNDVPAGQVPCNLRDVCNYCRNKDPESYSEFELEDIDFSSALYSIHGKLVASTISERRFPYCFKDVYNSLKGDRNQVHTRSLHAEENAFLQLAKYGGQGIQNGYLFTTASPCELCSKKSYQLGIKEIYYIDPYPGISFSHVLKFGNTHNPQLNLFYGAIGNAYVSLYTQRMPIKDELQLLTGISGKKAKKYLAHEAIYRLGVQDIKYVSREISFCFDTRDCIRSIEKVEIQALRDNISTIPISFYWSGSSLEGVEFTDHTNYLADASEGEKPSITYENKTESARPYIGIATLTPGMREGKSCKFETVVNLRDAAHIMNPCLSQFVPVLTDKLVLRVKARKNLLEDVRGSFYADENMDPEKKVQSYEVEISTDGEYTVYSYSIEHPDLNCTYCIEWNFSLSD